MGDVKGFGALIIGDEIIRGKRQDKHFEKLREILAVRGLHLDWVLYLGDDRPRLIEALKRSFASDDVVFSFGGIGATPDDHTRQAAAAAAGVPLELHPEAEARIRERLAALNRPITQSMLDMGRFPAGSRTIPNPVNGIVGFSCGDHHFVPGFPEMAWPMVEWVLDGNYAGLFHAHPEAEAAILVWDGIEGLLVDLMERVEWEFPGLTVFSLPSMGSASRGRHVELGVRGTPEQVPLAMREIESEVARRGLDFDRK
ncbi:MAG: competence/damage-inducible protein A [Rhodocyclaceae bacterium]|nr:competence/damage-inducible protein A [Rhodocyclaceae bacterium]